MRAAKRLQINNVLFNLPTVAGGAVEDYELKKHFPDYADAFECLEKDWSGIGSAYVPYAWTDEHYAYSDADADDFKDAVYGAQDLAASVSVWSGVACAMLFSCFLWTYFYKRKVRAEYRETLVGMELADKEGGGSEDGLLRIGSRADTVTF